MNASWVPGAAGSLYDANNLPYGVISRDAERPGVAARIGEYALDLAPLATTHAKPWASALAEPTLNELMALGRTVWDDVRAWLTELVSDEANRTTVEPNLIPLGDVTLRLPIEPADYVDFYSSLHHASNVGRIFRPDDEPLLPNWRHLPVGYHGRAGTIVVTGTDIARPHGQRKPPADEAPVFGPSTRLDIEAELGFVVGTPSALGSRVGTQEFDRHVFGAFLLNDWSARDLQAWESRPLGPFLAKSFATSIAAWVTPLAALEAARTDLPGQQPQPLDYLRVGPMAGYDIDIEIAWNGTLVAVAPYAAMYWSPAQMLAHLTVNGANLRTGDVFASGTVSGPGPAEQGSFLELSRGGTRPVTLADGSRRSFLADGDEVTLTARARGNDGGTIGLGEVRGRITAGMQRT